MHTDPHTSIQPLLLPPRAAAKLLSISERTLWSLTAPRGPIPSILIGRSVRYSVAALTAWIDAQQAQAAER
ncbi:MAG: helix-turn-helix transcriptional regulator [Planctomycetaceae bacterium]